MEEIVLSIDQMNYLVNRLGFSNIEASMIYVYNNTTEEYTLESVDTNKTYTEEDVPVFTLLDMLKLIPLRWQLSTITSGYQFMVIPEKTKMDERFPNVYGQTVLKTIYQAICYLRRIELI